MKEKVIKFLNFLFPKGNWRYYLMYLSSLFVLGMSSIFMAVFINLMIYGTTIDSGTYVTHMDFSGRIPTDYAISVMGQLYNLFGYLWLIMAVHTGLSLISDFIVRPILWFIKTVKVIVFGY